MDLPGWTTYGDTHCHDGYRIEPAGGPVDGGWVVHVQESRHPVLGSIEATHFTSLRAAKAAVIHHEVLVTRRTKMIRHAVLAVVGVMVAIPAFALMGPGESNRRVAFFVLGLVILLLTLRELVGLLILVTSHGWDYAYDMPELTIIDRGVADVATALQRAPSATHDSDQGQLVHVVPIDERSSTQ